MIINQEMAKSAMLIDRSSFEPVYIQLANILRKQIAEGMFRSGEQIPSESQLIQQYDVSPMTVRRTIKLLADQGVVITIRGRGTFVKEIEGNAAIFNLHDLHELIKLTSESTARTLECRVVSADEKIAKKLKQPAGGPILYVSRLFSSDGVPVLYQQTYIVYTPETNPEDELYRQDLYFSNSRDKLKFGDLIVCVALIGIEEARTLKIPVPSAVMRFEHIFFDFNDQPVSFGSFVVPGERCIFTTSLQIPAQANTYTLNY